MLPSFMAIAVCIRHTYRKRLKSMCRYTDPIRNAKIITFIYTVTIHRRTGLHSTPMPSHCTTLPHWRPTAQPHHTLPHWRPTAQPHHTAPHWHPTAQPHHTAPHWRPTAQPHHTAPHWRPTAQPHRTGAPRQNKSPCRRFGRDITSIAIIDRESRPVIVPDGGEPWPGRWDRNPRYLRHPSTRP